MNIETHINIFFDKLELEKNINFLDLYKHSAKITDTANNLNINSAYKRLIKALYLCKYIIYASKLEGNVLELGVLRGLSSYLLILLSKKINHSILQKNFYLIDSFEGLSEILPEDKIINSKLYQHIKGDLKANLEDVFQDIFDTFKI